MVDLDNTDTVEEGPKSPTKVAEAGKAAAISENNETKLGVATRGELKGSEPQEGSTKMKNGKSVEKITDGGKNGNGRSRGVRIIEPDSKSNN